MRFHNRSNLDQLHISRRSLLAGAITSAISLNQLIAQDKPSSDVSWLSEIQRPPKKLPEGTPELNSLLIDKNGNSIRRLVNWADKRKAIKQSWSDFLNPWEKNPSKAPDYKVLTEERVKNVIRQRIQYEVEPGLSTEAYLLKPANIKSGCPAVVVLHSTVNHSIHQPAGVKGKPEKAFGLKPAERGYVSICPRNFLRPTNARIDVKSETAKFQQRHPKSKGMAKMLHDSLVALEILMKQPEVDSNRLGTIGHSLGAKEALYPAAFDERIKATVSSEGGIGTHFSNWDAPWYLSDAINQKNFQLEHHEVLSLVAPRPFLLIGGDSADGDQSWPFIESVLPVYQLYGGPSPIGLFNHKQGHAVPQEAETKIYEWFDTYLKT